MDKRITVTFVRYGDLFQPEQKSAITLTPEKSHTLSQRSFSLFTFPSHHVTRPDFYTMCFYNLSVQCMGSCRHQISCIIFVTPKNRLGCIPPFSYTVSMRSARTLERAEIGNRQPHPPPQQELAFIRGSLCSPSRIQIHTYISIHLRFDKNHHFLLQTLFSFYNNQQISNHNEPLFQLVSQNPSIFSIFR